MAKAAKCIETLFSTQEVATLDTKAYSKINSDDKVAILSARNTMKEGTQDIDLHARGYACLNALTKSVEKVNGLKDVIGGLFGNGPYALMVMPSFIIRTNFSLEKGGLRSAPLRPRVRSEDERFEVHRGWTRRPGAGEHRRGGGIALWCLDCSRRKLDLMIQTQAAIACEISSRKSFRW